MREKRKRPRWAVLQYVGNSVRGWYEVDNKGQPLTWRLTSDNGINQRYTVLHGRRGVGKAVRRLFKMVQQ